MLTIAARTAQPRLSPAVLLRESYHVDGKVRKRTLANLSCLSAEVIEGLKVSTYLGHVSIAATQVYLPLTPELLVEASARFERYAALQGEQP